MTTPSSLPAPTDEPAVVVTHGNPDDDELAAVVAVVTMLTQRAAAARAASATTVRSAWSDPSGLVRAPLRLGPDAWRRSARG